MKHHALFRWALAILGACALWVTSAAPATAQQRGTIRGTVREAASQKPVEGVQVFIPGTQLTTTTDAQGQFELAGVSAGGAQLRVRAPGYSSALATTMVVGGQAVTVDFALNTSVIALDEVVVTGTGASTERKQLGNTIATVKADVVQDAPVHNFSEAIAAREAGVTILTSSGSTGEGARIRIRGNASLSQNNEPVVYVDGVRIDRGGGSIQPTGNVSRLDDINPEQIDHVEILKGAAAATLYGSEASAGVIQIFTKRGTQGRPKFTFRVDQGEAQYPKSRVKNNWAFVRGALPGALAPGNPLEVDTLNALFQNAPKNWGLGSTKGPLDALSPYDVFSVPGVSTNAYYSTGYTGTYSVNVSGGGADATYNVAGRMARERGPYDLSDLLGPYYLGTSSQPGSAAFANALTYNPNAVEFDRRYQGSATVTMFPKDRVTINAGLLWSDLFHQTPSQANNIYGVQSSLLNSRLFPANCNASIAVKLGDPFGVDPDRPGHCAGPGDEWGTQSFGTPREDAFRSLTEEGDHFNGNVKATYEPLPSKVRGDLTVGVDVTNSRQGDLTYFGNNVDAFSARIPDGYKYADYTYHREITVDGRLNWNAKASAFSSQATFGGQGFMSKDHFYSAEGDHFPGPGLQVAAAGAQAFVNETFGDVRQVGLLGQEQVGYKDWAFVTVGGRWDRNSAFGKSTSGAIYPKVNASLVLTDMPGWNINAISTLRLRGAVGKSGLQPGVFSRIATFSAGASELGAGLVPGNLGNDSLKPEVTTEYEGGAEVAFFQNKLGFDVTRWSRTTNDALYQVAHPASGGYLNSQLTNIGQLQASGWDLKVNSQLVDRPGFSLNLFANAAYLFQRVVDLKGSPPIKTGGSYARYRGFLKEGQPPGVLLGAQILQPCSSGTQYSRCMSEVYDGTNPTTGQVPFDVNGDGQPDTYDQLVTYLNTSRTCSGAVPRSYLDCFNNTTGIGPLLDDFNGNGDLLDNCLSPAPQHLGSGADIGAQTANGVHRGPTKPATRLDNNPQSATYGQTINYDMCMAKPWPDWSGAFGSNISLGRHFELSTLFEYRFGNYYISNLTDGFRNSSPTIGRNNQRPAELDEIMNNPASTGAQRADALLEFVNRYKELTPYDGLDLLEKGDFIRWREISVTYNAPQSLARRLGLNSVAFNLSGRNMKLWTGYTGIDPELNAVSGRSGSRDDNFLDSVDAWGFPLPSRVTLSIRFGF